VCVVLLLSLDGEPFIPEGIKLIPEGLYPDYSPSFSPIFPRNIQGVKKPESPIFIVRVK